MKQNPAVAKAKLIGCCYIIILLLLHYYFVAVTLLFCYCYIIILLLLHYYFVVNWLLLHYYFVYNVNNKLQHLFLQASKTSNKIGHKISFAVNTAYRFLQGNGLCDGMT